MTDVDDISQLSFEAALTELERIVAELKLALDGRRRYVGVLKSVSDGTIVVEVDGKAHSLPLERIQKARLRP